MELKELLEALGKQDTATLHEASGREGAMVHTIKSIAPGMRLCGPARTVWCQAADNLAIHRAVADAKPGEVLVIDAGGYREAGHWGEVLTAAAQGKGIAGVVIDGGVRDVWSVAKRGFPVFARGISIKAAVKEFPGKVNEPVVCGGVLVHPGDIVVGDEDGVVIIAREKAEEVLRQALVREDREAKLMRVLEEGEQTTLDLLGLRAKLLGKV